MTDSVPRFRPPPCKSSLTRALLLGWLAGDRTELRLRTRDPLPDDIRVVVAAMRSLGAGVEVAPDRIVIASDGAGVRAGPIELELGLNGTALRSLTAILGCLGFAATLRGAPGLARRPLGDLVEALERLGCTFDFLRESGRVPFRIESGRPRQRLRARLDLRATSQGATGLLLAFAASPHGGELEVTGPLAYLWLTRGWLRRFGCDVAVRADHCLWSVPGGDLATPGTVEVPCDPSSAAFALAFAAARGDPIVIDAWEETGHPDVSIVEHLRALGLDCRRDGAGGLALRGDAGTGDYGPIDLADAPDLFPPLIVLLSARPGRHRLHAAKLRHKESDRISVIATGLERLGFAVAEIADGIELEGVAPGASQSAAVTLDPVGDHRMAIAFALIGAIHGHRVHVREPECVQKSWPRFWEFLDSA